MAINFPASPSTNDTFTAGSITYKWDGAKWIGLGVTPADRLVEGSNSLEIDANNDLVWTGNNLKLVDTAETTASLFINGTKKSSWQAQDNFGTIIYSYDNEPLIFSTSSASGFSEKFRIDIDGKLLRGWQSTAFSGTNQASSIAIAGTSSQDGLQVIRYNTSFGAYGLTIGRSRGATIGTHGQVLSNDTIGNIDFVASDGANWRQSAEIEAGADGTITSTSSSGKLIFKTTKANATGATQAMTIKANHNVEIHDGNIVFETAGTGIDFSADGNASGMTSELLDDYEEGSWTPVIKSGTNTITATGGNQFYTYTKVGNKVTVYFALDGATTAGTTGGDFMIEGLPFSMTPTKGGNRTMGSVLMYYSSGLRASQWPTWIHLNSASTRLDIYEKSAVANSYGRATVGQVGAQSYVFGQITYNVE